MLGVALLSLGMFIVTFVLGFVPTKIRTSQRVMNLISIFGAGLLVGAALIVIVPEGMVVLVDAMNKEESKESTASSEGT